MSKADFDVLVIGGGIAGGALAIKANDLGLSVAVVTKTDIADCNTSYAQGGIVYKALDDTPELLVNDILAAAAGVGLPAAAEVVANEGPGIVEKMLLQEVPVDFDKDENGNLDRTEEAAHSRRRILHKTDITGKYIEEAMAKHIAESHNIKVFSNSTLVDLLTNHHSSNDPLAVYDDNRCLGAYILDNKTSKVSALTSAVTVAATGGLGQIYLHTTNPAVATGEAFAAAYRAGAELINMEYIQFHPTTLAVEGADSFLISESVRGEGAILKDYDGKPFMKRYHKLGSLAPRDIVARAIHSEMISHHWPYVYLDIASYMKPDSIKTRFPTIFEKCMENGIDCRYNPIPVVPAAHFSCGGIKTDLFGKTTMEGLYAVGEVSCTGLHGANRLASTSMLEGLVFGYRAAEDIAGRTDEIAGIDIPAIRQWNYTGADSVDNALIFQDFMTLKYIMWNYVGLIRSKRRLKRAAADLRHLWQETEDFYRNAKLTRELIELRGAIQTGLIISRAAWSNNVSRGCHYRKD